MTAPAPGPVNTEGFITAAQAAKIAGVTLSGWRSLRWRGQAPDPAIQLDGRTWLYDEQEVTNWARGYRKGRAARERGKP